MIIRTVELKKKDKRRFYDIALTNQGYAIQRNGRTITGRLSGYGANQILEDYIYNDLLKGWIIWGNRQDDNAYYTSLTR